MLGTVGSSLPPLVALSPRPSNPGNRVLEIGDQPAVRGRQVANGDGDGASRSRMNSSTRRPPGGAVGQTAEHRIDRYWCVMTRPFKGRLANTGYPLLQTSVVSLTFATTRGAGARAQARQPPKRGLATWTSGFGRMTATRARRSMSKRRPNRASRPGSRRPSP